MATVAPSFTKVSRGKGLKITWPTAATGDTITAATGIAGWNGPAHIQAEGTFGGATVGLTGSLDGTNFRALKQTPGGTDVGITAADIQPVGELANDYKPTVSGGTSDSITITLLLTKQ